MRICSCFLSKISLQPGMNCGQIPKYFKVTFSDTKVTGDFGVSSAWWGFCFASFLFFGCWERCYNHYFTSLVLRLPEMRGDTIREADKHWGLLHSALIVTILRLHSYNLGFLMWNNWQPCSADASCGLPALLISCVHTQTHTPLLLWVTETHFYFIFNILVCSFLPLQSLFFFFSNNRHLFYFKLELDDFNILNSSCQITNSLKKCCSDHPISYPGLLSAFRSFGVKNTHSAFCQIPNFRVIFYSVINSLSAFAEI